MAGIVRRNWTFDANVKDGAVNQDGVNIFLWDADTASPNFSLTTNVSGDIPQQSITESVFSVTGTDTVSEDEKNPYVVSVVKYGKVPLGFNLNFRSARTDAFFIQDDAFITESVKATTAAATGFTINHTTDTVTLSESKSIDQIYDKLANEAVDAPQKDFPGGIMTTVDGTNYILNYDLAINTGLNLNGQNRIVAVDNVTANGSAVVADLQITGNLSYGSATSLSNVVVTGVTDFTSDSNITLNNTELGEITNSSGGIVVLSLTDGSVVGTNTGPDIVIVNPKIYTLTNIQANTEIRIFTYTNVDDPNTYTEIAGINDISGPADATDNNLTISGSGPFTAEYAYNYSSDTGIVTVAFNTSFNPLRRFDTLINEDQSIQIFQITDRQYF
jgi:hypothetical protein